jgi:pSer/pThr/pTyr-binding forkhead associated (FHA) protein
VLKGSRFDLRSALSHVGRGPHNDVVITDDSVSDSHAKLQKREAGWYVVDMGSTNGTYVGGRRINGEALLTGAPDVRFGGVKLLFRASGDAADDAKGTRAIAGVTAEQARRMREASQPRASAAPAPAPAEPVPASRGIPAWVWIVALLLAAAVGFFILQGR